MMKNQVAVLLEERIFNDLSVKAQMQDNISPLLQNTLDKIQCILDAEKISSQNELEAEEANKLLKILKNIKPKDKSEEDRVITKIQKMEVFFNQKQKRKSFELFDLRPLLIKAAILLDDIESIRIIMSYVELELSNNITLLNNKINYSSIAKYAIDKKHLDLLDYPIISDTIEKNIFKNLDYKLKIFLESDADIIAKITSKIPDIFNKKTALEQISIADLGILYHDAVHYTSYENQKNSITKKRSRILSDDILTPSIIKNNIFKLNKLFNNNDYSAIVHIDIRLLEIFYQLIPEIFKNLPQSEKNNILFFLCKNAEPDSKILIDFILKIGAKINGQDNDGNTSLHLATVNDCIEIVKLLLEKGANIEAKDSNDLTPLHCASLNGNLKLVKLLLEKGANIEAKDIYDLTPLHRVVETGHIETVKLLLEKNANIEAKDSFNLTPLHRVVETGHIETVKLLLEKNANIEAKDSGGHTPLHHAAYHGHIEIVRLLLEEGANIEAKDSIDLTPLHHAAHYGHIEIVRLLLEKNANIEAKDSIDLTPLHHTITAGHIEIVRLLLEKKANIEARSNKGLTPLHLALQNDQIEMVRLLLEEKADIKTTNNNGNTALHLAVLKGHVEILKLLLGYDIGKESLNHQDRDGNTALHFAVINNLPKIVDILLANDNINLTLRAAKNNETALEVARRLNLEVIIEAISDKEKKLATKQSATWGEKISAQVAGSNRKL
jgi:ankyrin repeat protein